MRSRGLAIAIAVIALGLLAQFGLSVGSGGRLGLVELSLALLVVTPFLAALAGAAWLVYRVTRRS
jgi:hypothetical protein